MAIDWQPSASLDTLKKRAQLLGQLRCFFVQRQVLEVEVPILCEQAITDVHIESIPARVAGPRGMRDYFLATSPEYAMKRLLAAGSGPIYSLGKVFRQAEQGKRHSPEFTLLEWYRPGWDEFQLMDEVTDLLGGFFPRKPCTRASYVEVFDQVLGVNPHTATDAVLRKLVTQHVTMADGVELDRADCLDVLFSFCVEPTLSGICFIYDYPACQAALARFGSNVDGERIARRFEVFVDGMELGNGYFELNDAIEQRRRFEQDNEQRKQQGKTCYELDEKLLAALHSGLPDCAGVALGVDRLLMQILGVAAINEVHSFGPGQG